MAAAEAIRCGVCQFWSPTANGCVSVPLKYECAGEVGSTGLMGCGVECAYYEEDGEHGERREAGEREREERKGVETEERERKKTRTHTCSPPLPSIVSLSLSTPPGHCVDIDRDECTAISPDQYAADIAALVAKRDAGQIPAGELRMLPPLPAQQSTEEEATAAEPAAPAEPEAPAQP
jgi:hypothetical protein